MTKVIKNNSRQNAGSSSESITLRFDKSTLNELRKEAELKLESVNTLINQIVKAYTLWHKPAASTGLIYINKYLYRDILESLSDEQVKEVADKFVRHYFIDMIEMFDNTVSIPVYISVLLKWIEISEFKYRIYEDRQSDYVTYKFQFDLGLKFSQFMANLIKNTIESLDQTGTKVEVTEHLVILRLPKSIL
jgi:hypothetical protein